MIVSRSPDGDIQNAIFKRLGFCTVRGSAGRGGARAAVGAIRAHREGGVLAITPDGPRGPAGEVQDGILLIAQRSGARIVSVGAAATPAWTASKSWDRYMVPTPFARAVMMAGEGLTVSPDATPGEREALRQALRDAIARTQADSERVLKESAAPRFGRRRPMDV